MARPSSRRQLVSNELLEHAARLFTDKGFAATSLQDIADAMGISRPSLYTYVRNKEELLAALVQDVLGPTVRILEEAIARTDAAADVRLTDAVHAMAVHNCRNTTRFRLLDRSEPHLPPELAAEHRDSRRRVLALLVTLVEDAIAAGAVRPVPARTAALSILGMLNWIAWWYRAGVDDPAEDVADVMTRMTMAGIQRDDGRSPATSPWTAVTQLREDLAQLERTLAAVVPPETDRPG
ncbi:TetR/AcrR family transcriptional regulator [Pseudonocardia broussonetiae]|uniref:TetR/AcrR family transcriptional regulator n=1 Tax=Pseudonocardia broussonetiae TaxID=2736640 RepID=A0A6M6JDD7_9PSEU|nr:TetR/AcrR family transcriptional regulator [Pseudonocardia broussonetiae]QJY44499.1 TetR/AcrR family transcriptional regulator [Pseudonocardia broussonetiae]